MTNHLLMTKEKLGAIQPEPHAVQIAHQPVTLFAHHRGATHRVAQTVIPLAHLTAILGCAIPATAILDPAAPGIATHDIAIHGNAVRPVHVIPTAGLTIVIRSVVHKDLKLILRRLP